MGNSANKLIIVLTAIYFAIFWGISYGQEFSKEEVKAELTVRLINYISWKNEQLIDSYKIAFIGTEPQYYTALETVIADRQIKGRNIQLSAIDSLQNLENFHVLVVAGDSGLPFSRIALTARGTNTLLVSAEEDEQVNIMINILQSEDNTIGFELNRPNILLEQLLISNQILLLGGTELDVAKLYGEMELELSLLVEQLRSTQAQSSLASDSLVQSRNLLTEVETELSETQSSLQLVNQTLNEHKSIIAEQEIIIQSRQDELDQVSQSSDVNQDLLSIQAAQLIQRSIRIRQQQERVRENEGLLGAQLQQLARQKSSIEKQNSTIREQELQIYVILIVLVLFLILVFRLYRISQDLEQLNLEQEERGLALEEEVKDRTSEAVASERHYKALSDCSPVGLYQTDNQGNCTYVNERWCEYSGLTRQQAMGNGWIQAVHPDDRSKLHNLWENHLRTKMIFNSEHRFLSPNGGVRWLLGQCEAEYDTEGVVQGHIGTVTDITDLKRLQEQLRRTQKMDSLGMLTGGIAHDYNNMLAIISGFAELLQIELTEQPALLELVDPIVHASARGTTLTKKLLAFSSLEASDAKLVSINSLLKYHQQMLEKMLTPRIQLILNLDDKLWPTWVDDGDLEDALVNICINAMHAMDGGGTLTVCTRNLTVLESESTKLGLDSGEYALLSITDTGIGMDEETKEKIFDPFFTTKGTQGTGLGLTQVYSFVERSKGIIKIDSSPGKGAQILIYFPRYINNGEPIEAEINNFDINFKGTETLLVVDDEEVLLKLACDILSREGYKTLKASNGQDALKILEETAVDLVLSDVIMPEMDGYQLANTIQRLYPAIKIQLVSGFIDDIQQHNVDDNLIQNRLLKPYHPHVLLKRVTQLLHSSYPIPIPPEVNP